MTITEKAIAYDMLKDGRLSIAGIAKAATEAADGQVRQFFGEALGEAVQEYFRLADLAAGKGWRRPRALRRQPGGGTGLAPRELLELHGIVRGEATCARKLEAAMTAVRDAELKAFMQNSLQLKRENLRDYRRFFADGGRQ